VGNGGGCASWIWGLTQPVQSAKTNPRCRRVLEGQGLSGSLPTELGVLSQMYLLCVPHPHLAVRLSSRRQLTMPGQCLPHTDCALDGGATAAT
jgi:hypothetical protein